MPTINSNHSLAKGLLDLWLFDQRAGQTRSLVRNKEVTHTGSVVPTSGSNYRNGAGAFRQTNGGVKLTSTSDKITLVQSDQLLPLNTVTVVIGSRKTDTTNRASCAFQVDSSTSTTRLSAHLPYSDGTVYFDFGGFSNGSSRVTASGLTFGSDLWVFTTGPRGMEIWQNGILRASNSANPTRATTTANWLLGTGALGGADLAEYDYLGLWNRQLSPTEIKQISSNPYSIFRKPSYTTTAPIATGSSTLPSLVNLAAGIVTFSANSVANLAPLTASGNATGTPLADGSIGLPSLVAAGTANAPFISTGDTSLIQLTASGVAVEKIIAEASTSLSSLVSLGTAIDNLPASGSVSLALLETLSNATVISLSTGTPSLQALTAFAEARTSPSATGTISLAALNAFGEATGTPLASGTASLNAMAASGQALEIISASSTALLTALTASGSASFKYVSSAGISLPKLTSSSQAAYRATFANIYSPLIPPISVTATDDEFADESGSIPSGWTEIDFGSVMAITEDEAGLALTGTNVAGYSAAGMYKAVPAGDFTIWTLVSLSGNALAGTQIAGLALFQDATSSTGDLISLDLKYNNGADTRITRETWTAYNATPTTTFAHNLDLDIQPTHTFLRIRRTGTTYSFDFSTDGVGWMLAATSGTISFTPTHFGLISVNNGSGVTTVARFQFFRYIASDVGTTGSVDGDRFAWGISAAVTLPSLTANAASTVNLVYQSTGNAALSKLNASASGWTSQEIIASGSATLPSLRCFGSVITYTGAIVNPITSIDGVTLTYQPSFAEVIPAKAVTQQMLDGSYIAGKRPFGAIIKVTWGVDVMLTAIEAELVSLRNSSIDHVINFVGPDLNFITYKVEWISDPEFRINTAYLYDSVSISLFERE